MDRGAWWATIHRVAKSWTQLSDWAYNTHACARTRAHTHTQWFGRLVIRVLSLLFRCMSLGAHFWCPHLGCLWLRQSILSLLVPLGSCCLDAAGITGAATQGTRMAGPYTKFGVSGVTSSAATGEERGKGVLGHTCVRCGEVIRPTGAATLEDRGAELLEPLQP